MTNFAFDTMHFPPTAAPPFCARLDVVNCTIILDDENLGAIMNAGLSESAGQREYCGH